MHPNDRGTLDDCNDRSGNARRHAFFHIPAGEFPECGLSRQANEYRPPGRAQLSQIRQQLDIVPGRLAESDAGVHDDAVLAKPGRSALAHPLRQEIPDLRDHVNIVGLLLHGAGLAPHVHEAYRPLQRNGGLQRTLFAERADIVDHRGSRGDRGMHDGGFAGIDGYRRVDSGDDGLDHGNDAVEFFLFGDVGCARTRGFAADIDDVRTIPGHRLGPAHGRVAPDKSAAVRERVGCHVEDPHHRGDVEPQLTEGDQCSGAGPPILPPTSAVGAGESSFFGEPASRRSFRTS